MNNIEKTSCELIIQEIDKKGFANVASLQNCIDKVKRVLNIDLEVSESGFLIYKNNSQKQLLIQF